MPELLPVGAEAKEELEEEEEELMLAEEPPFEAQAQDEPRAPAQANTHDSKDCLCGVPGRGKTWPG